MVTNADKIRSMSSEDLEELLRHHNIVCDLDREWCESRTEGCQNCTKMCSRSPHRKSRTCWLPKCCGVLKRHQPPTWPRWCMVSGMIPGGTNSPAEVPPSDAASAAAH